MASHFRTWYNFGRAVGACRAVGLVLSKPLMLPGEINEHDCPC